MFFVRREGAFALLAGVNAQNYGATQQADGIGLASSERLVAPLKRQAGLARQPIGKLERPFGAVGACEALQQLEKATIRIEGADVIRVRCLGIVESR